MIYLNRVVLIMAHGAEALPGELGALPEIVGSDSRAPVRRLFGEKGRGQPRPCTRTVGFAVRR